MNYGKATKKLYETAEKPVKKTNGYKTYVAAFIWILVNLFGDKVSWIRDNQLLIEQGLEWAVQLGVGHKLLRWIVANWKTAKTWTVEKFKILIKKLKKDGR